jgi:hypothetical protein
MGTVAKRTMRSTPHRDAMQTWAAIVGLLTRGRRDAARTELLSVGGIAASVIADHAAKTGAIVVTCDGPRTRIYCLYDDDAIDGSDANEDALGFDPLKGDWAVSLPCHSDDLAWVQSALKKLSARITAREMTSAVEAEQSNQSAEGPLVLDVKGFLG